uniref:Myb_DNA-bind_5 domain-containing protein n=1 Tax=Angiostrongylus cantonensis TaxID=6313 RepID=A0A0K0CUU5_ANGCA
MYRTAKNVVQEKREGKEALDMAREIATGNGYDHILADTMWCLLDTSLVPSFSTSSDHSSHEDSIQPQAGKEFTSSTTRKSPSVYDEKILNEILCKHDWLIKEGPTEDYELLVEGLESRTGLASVSQTRRWDRISTTTKKLREKRREKRRKLNLDPTVTRLTRVITRVIINAEKQKSKTYIATRKTKYSKQQRKKAA